MAKGSRRRMSQSRPPRSAASPTSTSKPGLPPRVRDPRKPNRGPGRDPRRVRRGRGQVAHTLRDPGQLRGMVRPHRGQHLFQTPARRAQRSRQTRPHLENAIETLPRRSNGPGARTESRSRSRRRRSPPDHRAGRRAALLPRSLRRPDRRSAGPPPGRSGPGSITRPGASTWLWTMPMSGRPGDERTRLHSTDAGLLPSRGDGGRGGSSHAVD